MYKHLLILYLLIGLSSCGMFGSKDNTEKPAPLVEFTPTLTLKMLWTAYTGGGARESYLKVMPAFHDGQLFTVSPNGLVKAFNFSDGKLIWKQQVDIPISGGPGIGNGVVLVGSHKGNVVALSAIDGTEQWRTQVSSEVLVAPQINQGTVVVRTIDGKLFGLNSQTGERIWIYEDSRVPLLSLRGVSTPIVTQDLIIAGFDDGKIAALELQTGKPLWRAPIAIPSGRSELEQMVDIDADPLLIDGTIYVTSYQGRTVAIDIAQGSLLWEKESPSYASLGVDVDYLYMSDAKSYVWAFDRYSGEQQWQQDKLKNRHVTAPVSVGDYVVVGDIEGYLHWMQRDNGQFVARYRMDDASILVSPLVVDNVLIAYNSEGKVIVLQPE